MIEEETGFVIYLVSETEEDFGLYNLTFSMRIEIIDALTALYGYPDLFFTETVKIWVMPCKIASLHAIAVDDLSINYDSAVVPLFF